MVVEISPWDGDTGPEGGSDVCDGAGDEAHEGVSSTPRSRGWGDGWPRCQTKMLVTTTTANGVKLSVRREIAPLVALLCQQTIDRGYSFRSGQCWGFACRSIRGSSSPSNHSWGLAVDVNSLANPMGPSLVTDMPAWLPELWTGHGFRWGGSYTARKDAMHFEYMGTPDDVARLVTGLGGAPVVQGTVPRPEATPAAQPGAAPPFPLPAGHHFGEDEAADCHSGRRPEDRALVRQLQERMIQRGWNLGASGADGFFGAKVRAAVVGFQREKGLDVDGLVGPSTWRALWETPVT